MKKISTDKLQKINYFSLNISNYYKHTKHLNYAQKGELMDMIIAYMDDDKLASSDSVVNKRFKQIKNDLEFAKNRAKNLKKKNTQNAHLRWQKDSKLNTILDNKVMPSHSDCNANYNVNDNINNKDIILYKETKPTRELADINNKDKKARYGEFQNVLLSADELAKLEARFPGRANELIKKLDEGIELKGYKYKSHYLAILKWEEKDNKKEEKNSPVKIPKEFL